MGYRKVEKNIQKWLAWMFPYHSFPVHPECPHIFTKKLTLKKKVLGHLAGSISRACDSKSWGCNFEPHIGCRDYLKITFKKKSNYHI